MNKISKDEAWKIYETLPQDLKTAIFSEETANSILSASQRNGLSEQQTSQTAELVGLYLLGVLPIENLAQEIMQATSASQAQVSQIILELTRLVFHSIQNSLDTLYNLKPKEKTVAPATGEGEKETPAQVMPTQAEKPQQLTPQSLTREDDTYREPVE
ncbi:MAG: hypothetical protein V1819_01415 [bacterium]